MFFIIVNNFFCVGLALPGYFLQKRKEKSGGFLQLCSSEKSKQTTCSTVFFTLPGNMNDKVQGCIFRLTCSYPQLTEDHVLTSVYVKIYIHL